MSYHRPLNVDLSSPIVATIGGGFQTGNPYETQTAKTDLSRRLREFRQKVGWSQLRLARELGIAPSTLRRWEAGESYPSPLAQEKLNRVIAEANR